mmetsp:Transcript_10704/g.15996  ORF Transcript_10704/g.15996 Transcript_10704/m.15996 type:complete len:470 (-) Transcript_10704:258-1667(-)
MKLLHVVEVLVLLVKVQPTYGFITPSPIKQFPLSTLKERNTFSQPSSSRLFVATTLPETKQKKGLREPNFDENADVVCARGVCTLADEEVVEELCHLVEDTEGNLIGMECVENPAAADRNVFSFDYLWPRALLLGCSLLYGTNFPLGRIMNEALPASATTAGRMLLATVALFPFLLQLKPELRKTAVLGGSFCALGYLSQSIALVDTPAATVAFLGALVVIITPTTSALIDKVPMGWKDAPQTWLAAILCLAGVGALELGGSGLGDVGWGDFWSAMQAVGFGVGFFFTERMMAKEPDQALSITACQVGMTAFWGSIWAVLDGTGVLGNFAGDHGAWLLDETTRSQYSLQGLLYSGFFGGDESLRLVAIAAVWTGLITTAANRVGETTGLGKMKSSEAAVLLATEPLFAALFASFLVGETLGLEDMLGGALIVTACVTTSLKPQDVLNFFGVEDEDEELTLEPAEEGDFQ